MKPKFQVGDHVVVKSLEPGSNFNWRKGVVAETRRIGNQRFYKVEFNDGCYPWYLTARQLENDTEWYISQSEFKRPKSKAEFKTGDSVVIKNMKGFSSYLNGMTGMISLIYGTPCGILACEYMYRVKFDDGSTHDFVFKNLEHVKCGKKIQYKFKMGDNLEVIENDCYKTKGKVVKMGYDNDLDIKWYVLKQEDGKFSPELIEDCLVLVEKPFNPKFKVNDLVILSENEPKYMIGSKQMTWSELHGIGKGVVGQVMKVLDNVGDNPRYEVSFPKEYNPNSDCSNRSGHVHFHLREKYLTLVEERFRVGDHAVVTCKAGYRGRHYGREVIILEVNPAYDLRYWIKFVDNGDETYFAFNELGLLGKAEQETDVRIIKQPDWVITSAKMDFNRGMLNKLDPHIASVLTTITTISNCQNH